MDARADRVADRFERPLVAAAVLTIPVTILQLLPAGDPWRTIADVLNWAIWLAFLAEVLVMLAVVSSRRQWLRGHVVEVAIVVLTPPFLVSVVQSVRLLRLLRLLRLMRLAPLVRALFSAEGLRYAALLTFLTALTGGAAFASVENKPVGDGVYWAITTMNSPRRISSSTFKRSRRASKSSSGCCCNGRRATPRRPRPAPGLGEVSK